MRTFLLVLTFCLLAVVFKVLRGRTSRRAREKRHAACYSSPTVNCILAVALDTAKGIGFMSMTKREGALADVARAQAEAGDVTGALETAKGALETARGIDDAKNRARNLAQIAVVLAEVESRRC